MLTTGLVASRELEAAPGDVDPTFGMGGKVITDFGSQDSEDARAILLQPDGKIVVAGSVGNIFGTVFALARYESDGTLDASFGQNGKITTEFAGHDDATAAALQPDGKIVVVGYGWRDAPEDFALARYLSDGSLDPSFGDGGKTVTAIGSDRDLAYAVALQADGKIVVAGEAGGRFTLARYSADGTLDATFAVGGVAQARLDSFAAAFAVAVQSDGKIVAGGTRVTQTAVEFGEPDTYRYEYDFALARYQSDGALDPSFGSGGTVRTDLEARDTVRGLVLQPDGKIVVAGENGDGILVARYDTHGVLDPGFGDGGFGVIDVRTESGRGHALALDDDGRIVVAADAFSYDVFTGGDFVLLRLKSNGTPDLAFGSGGLVRTDFASGVDVANAIVMQPDGRIILGGFANTTAAWDVALARYEGGVCPDGAPCDDVNVCTSAETCLAGDCVGASATLDGMPCDDHDECTNGETCGAGMCRNGGAVRCGACEQCLARFGCIVTPRPACLQPTAPRQTVLMFDNAESPAALHGRNQLRWRWRGDSAGAVIASDEVALCIYDGLDELAFRARVAPAGRCGRKGCWHASPASNQLTYRNPEGFPDGLTGIRFRSRAGKTDVIVHGAGPQLQAPRLPSHPWPVLVQLQGAGEQCWGAEYVPEGIIRNGARLFRGFARAANDPSHTSR